MCFILGLKAIVALPPSKLTMRTGHVHANGAEHDEEHNDDVVIRSSIALRRPRRELCPDSVQTAKPKVSTCAAPRRGQLGTPSTDQENTKGDHGTATGVQTRTKQNVISRGYGDQRATAAVQTRTM